MAKAGPTMPTGLIESWAQGLEDAIPTLPLFKIVRAESDDVAVPSTVVVAKYKFPPAFLNVH